MDFNAVNEQEVEAGRPDQIINRPKRIRHKRSAPEPLVKNIRKKKRNSGQEFLSTKGQAVSAKSPKQLCR